MSDLIRIDAHQHFWDIESGRYTWPTPADGAIYRTYTPADLEPELGPAGIDATVLVQTVATLDDTDSMLAVADRHAFVGAVVGWVPLADSHAAEAALDARPHPRLRGIRHLIHHEPDPEWLLRGDVTFGLNVLARRGLTFDTVAVFPDHLRLVPVVADRHPDLTVVLDHLAKPPFRSVGWSSWHDQLRRAAARPNVVAKLSGLHTAAGPGWTREEIRPAVEAAIDAFGPERLMFGSDWPVCQLVSTYREVIEAIEGLVSPLTASERSEVLGGTAARVYGM
ncbi:MAG: amidohydrolase family protein [Candidatus Limnocylindrales bacterium]